CSHPDTCAVDRLAIRARAAPDAARGQTASPVERRQRSDILDSARPAPQRHTAELLAVRLWRDARATAHGARVHRLADGLFVRLRDKADRPGLADARHS